jgi:hypothetical protein
MPNVATTAIGFAATITAVDWILRHEARERLRPRTEAMLDGLGLDIRMFISTVMLDYAETHMHTYRPMPGDVVGLLDQWRQDHDAEDAVREDMDDNRGRRVPLIVIGAVDLAKQVERTRARDLDVLEPALVRAMDEFSWAAWQGLQLCDLAAIGGNDPNDHRRVAAALIVNRLRELATVFFRYGRPVWREIPDLSRRGTDEHHANLVAMRGR